MKICPIGKDRLDFTKVHPYIEYVRLSYEQRYFLFHVPKEVRTYNFNMIINSSNFVI
jgi:hypothetical protein